jgi:CRISPR-associated protein Csd1
LHYLLRNKKHNRKVGSVLYLFWGIESIDPMGLLTEPTLEDLKRLLGAPHIGGRPSVKSEDFYLIALSGGGGRIIARDFLQIPIDKINQNLQTWFTGQQLVDFGGVDGSPLGLYQLMATAYRDPKKDLQTRELSSMTRTALFGTRPPVNLLSKVITRVQAANGPYYRQCVLIKLLLNYQGISLMATLDERLESLTTDSHKTAYCLGRLMALYESIQWYAIGNVNSSVTDRVYSSASTTPARIFGRLESSGITHIKILKRKKPRLGFFFENKSADIHGRIPAARYPTILKLEEQGIFALGYWQQKSDRKPKDVQEEIEGIEKEQGLPAAVVAE